MLSLIQFNLPLLAAAFAIGLATARWTIRRPAAAASSEDKGEA